MTCKKWFVIIVRQHTFHSLNFPASSTWTTHPPVKRQRGTQACWINNRVALGFDMLFETVACLTQHPCPFCLVFVNRFSPILKPCGISIRHIHCFQGPARSPPRWYFCFSVRGGAGALATDVGCDNKTEWLGEKCLPKYVSRIWCVWFDAGFSLGSLMCTRRSLHFDIQHAAICCSSRFLRHEIWTYKCACD